MHESVGLMDTPLPLPPNPSSTPTPSPVRSISSAPGWVPEEQRKSGIGPLVIVLVAALVTVAVYMLGKNFIFPNY